jgi:4-hydroxybenzoate polyprenyltransferase
MIKRLENLIEKIEKLPTNFYLWLISFLSIITSRILIETWLGGMVNKTGDYFFHHTMDVFCFFFLAYIIFLILLMSNLRIKIKEASNVMLWGYLIIIVPPIIDFIILKERPFLSFYGFYGLAEMPKRFFTFFGDSPDFGITYGVRFEIAFTVLALLVYSYLKTRNKLKSLGIALQAYLVLFILATFPSWITILIYGFSKGFMNIGDQEIVQLFLTSARLFSRETGTYLNALSIKLSIIYALILFFVINGGAYVLYRKQFIAFVKNSRPVQLIYHQGLFMTGIGLGIFFTKFNWDLTLFNLVGFIIVSIAIACAWLASVVVNDIYDRKIDQVTNKSRPLVVSDFSQENYITVGVILFVVSILFSAMVNPKVAFILIAYQGLACLYSAWPFRLKRFLGVASLVSSLASLLILFSGFILASPLEDITQVPSRIMWLIGFALIFALPIKDLKDVEGDKLDNVKTVFVVFGEYWGKVIVGGGIFLSYILSSIFLNEPKLLPGAIFFGGVSFWIVVLAGQGKKITNRNLIWWVMGTLVIYMSILVKVVFILK